jgi:carbonic anhydrase
MTDSEARSGQVSRRRFMRTGSAGMLATGLAGSLLAGGPATAASAMPELEVSPGPQEALRLLMEGNSRWVRGRARHPHQSVAWRNQVAPHQDPFATVVSCIDSRVPPELVFDRGLSDMFVVRAGAQAVDQQVVLGSIEFGPVNYPSARLLFVLGHQRCGAVQAAIQVIQSNIPAPGHIQAVVNALRPAYRVAVGQPGDLVDNMVRAQIQLTVRQLQLDPPLRKLTESEGLVIVGGYYQLDSGAVELLA